QAAFRPNITGTSGGDLYLYSERSMPVRIAVFNVTGIPVDMSWEIELEGEAIIPVDAARLPAGVYFVAIMAGGERQILRFSRQ
ncbi:MAG: T9SS type A sorting domain-containing protein, partial [Saprospiraceae bacterium]|nr:T9SS type A sorting domain-containing protein [Saprospiraceae bacterium]